jgi:DnaJ family protein C protein 13
VAPENSNESPDFSNSVDPDSSAVGSQNAGIPAPAQVVVENPCRIWSAFM